MDFIVLILFNLNSDMTSFSGNNLISTKKFTLDKGRFYLKTEVFFTIGHCSSKKIQEFDKIHLGTYIIIFLINYKCENN